jgi:O-antigen biosynthesis protein WbqP
MNYVDTGKRTLDIAVACILLVISSPLLVGSALAIWLEDRQTPLFRQMRVGRHREPFQLLKFRSMRMDTEHVQSSRASNDWVTQVGRVLRRTSLDELPQLWCVLRGDMSLVGPRPALPSQSELIELRDAKGAYAVRPGMTGLAQLRAYDGMADGEKSDHDAEYAAHVSLWGDLRILLGTIRYITRKPPTY